VERTVQILQFLNSLSKSGSPSAAASFSYAISAIFANTCSCSLGRWGLDATRRVAAVSGRSVGGRFFCRGILQRIVLCSRRHRSNIFSEPSAPIEKMFVELGNRATSYTSRSIVRDQLHHRRRRVQVPTRARRIKRGGCDNEARRLLVPRRIGEQSAALALHLGLQLRENYPA
jgi:hypothetical protein